MIIYSLKFLNCLIYIIVGDFIKIFEKFRIVLVKLEGI